MVVTARRRRGHDDRQRSGGGTDRPGHGRVERVGGGGRGDGRRPAGGRPLVLDRNAPADGVPWIECDLADTRAAEARPGSRRTLRRPRRRRHRRRHRRARPARRRARTTWDRIVAVDLLATAAVIRAALPWLEAVAGQRRHGRLHPRRQGGRRRHRVLRREVRRRRLHPRPRRRAGRRGRRHPAHPRRHAHRLLRRPGRAVPAGPRRQPQRPRRHRRRRHVRPLPTARAAPSAGSWWSAPSGVVVPVILVLRALGVGDLATGVPALRALRAAHPDREWPWPPRAGWPRWPTSSAASTASSRPLAAAPWRRGARPCSGQPPRTRAAVAPRPSPPPAPAAARLRQPAPPATPRTRLARRRARGRALVPPARGVRDPGRPCRPRPRRPLPTGYRQGSPSCTLAARSRPSAGRRGGSRRWPGADRPGPPGGGHGVDG